MGSDITGLAKNLELIAMGNHIIKLVLLISAATSSYAADFRALDLGSPCVDIPVAEEALGSVQIPWQPGNKELIAFRGKVFDRETSIVYFCPNGKLFTGNYFFPKESLEKAQSNFDNAYNGLVSIYGAPFIDSSPIQYGNSSVDPRLISPNHRYMASWNTARINATVSLLPDGDPEGSNWHVLVVIGKPIDRTGHSKRKCSNSTEQERTEKAVASRCP